MTTFKHYFIAHLRYFLGGRRPSETSILTDLKSMFFDLKMILLKLLFNS